MSRGLRAVVIIAAIVTSGVVTPTFAAENDLQTQQDQSPQGGAAADNQTGSLLQSPSEINGLQSAGATNGGAAQAASDAGLQQGASADQVKLFIQGDVDSQDAEEVSSRPLWLEVLLIVLVAAGSATAAAYLWRRRLTGAASTQTQPVVDEVIQPKPMESAEVSVKQPAKRTAKSRSASKKRKKKRSSK